MKAAVYERFGPPEVVHLAEVDKPVPRENEFLVRVCATTVTSADWRIRSQTLPSPLFWLPMRLIFGLTKPRNPILGTEFSGEVVAIGNRVQRVEVGDQLIVSTGVKMGTHAEYVCVPENSVFVKKPASMSFEVAASFSFGGLTSLHYLRDLAKLKAKDKILIYGASGAVGCFAIQLAKHFGAQVTGVCGTKHVDLVKNLGADEVIDYTKSDFTQSSTQYDFVFDTVGKTSFAKCQKLLEHDGAFLAAVLTGTEIGQMIWTSMRPGKKVLGGVVVEKIQDLELLKSLLEEGKIKSVIDRSYSLSEIVEAHRHVESGHKTGSVVVTM